MIIINYDYSYQLLIMTAYNNDNNIEYNIDYWLLITDYWLMIIDYWLIIGYWLLIVDYRY